MLFTDRAAGRGAPDGGAGAAVMLGGSYALIYALRARAGSHRPRPRARARQRRASRSPARRSAASRTSSCWGSSRPISAASASRRWRSREIDAASAVIGEVPRYMLKASASAACCSSSSSCSSPATAPRRGAAGPRGLRLRRPPAVSRAAAGLCRVHLAALRPADARPAACGHDGDRLPRRRRLPAGPSPRRCGCSERSNLRDVEYAYPRAERAALRGLDLTHPGPHHRRHRRRHRRRQDHGGRPRSSACSSRSRATIRVDGVPVDRGEPARLAERHRLRAAADLPDRRHGRRPTSPSASRARADRPGRGRARRADRRAARLRDERAAAGLRHPGRRARRAALAAASASASASPARSTTIPTC